MNRLPSFDRQKLIIDKILNYFNIKAEVYQTPKNYSFHTSPFSLAIDIKIDFTELVTAHASKDYNPDHFYESQVIKSIGDITESPFYEDEKRRMTRKVDEALDQANKLKERIKELEKELIEVKAVNRYLEGNK